MRVAVAAGVAVRVAVAAGVAVRVAVRVDSVTLGGFGLPESVRASSAAAVESAIGQLVPSTVTVQKVTLGEGTVTIEGVTQR